MAKREQGHKEMKEVWIAGELKYYCDNCSKECTKDITFQVDPEIAERCDDIPHFCNYECMYDWLLNERSPYSKIKRTLNNSDSSCQSIYVKVDGLEGLKDLMNAH